MQSRGGALKTAGSAKSILLGRLDKQGKRGEAQHLAGLMTLDGTYGRRRGTREEFDRTRGLKSATESRGRQCGA